MREEVRVALEKSMEKYSELFKILAEYDSSGKINLDGILDNNQTEDQHVSTECL